MAMNSETDFKENSSQKDENTIDCQGRLPSIIVGKENATEIGDLVSNPSNGGERVESSASSNAGKAKESNTERNIASYDRSDMHCDRNLHQEEIKGNEKNQGDNITIKTAHYSTKSKEKSEVSTRESSAIDTSIIREDVGNIFDSMERVDEKEDMTGTSIKDKEELSYKEVHEQEEESESDQAIKKTESVLDESVEKEWLDILGNGLLKKKIIVPGKGPETRPKPGNEVTMIVNGVLMDGTELKEETLVFIHDDRELIQAFELAVALMELGEKSTLYTDAKYAYGPNGCDSPNIPKDCNITYTLEIVSITEGPDKDNITDNERIRIGDKKRIIGNSLYSRGDYGSAIDCYKRALKYLDGSANTDVIKMKVKCQNNLSAAQLKVNAHQAALQSCNAVLALQSGNIKAMFRKSKCLEALGKQSEALKCLKEASMIDPHNKMVYNELMRLDKYVKKSLRKESDMYKRMVGGVKKEENVEGNKDDTNISFKIMIGTLVVAGLGVLAGFIWNRH